MQTCDSDNYSCMKMIIGKKKKVVNKIIPGYHKFDTLFNLKYNVSVDKKKEC